MPKSAKAQHGAKLSPAKLRLAAWLNLLAGVVWLVAFALKPMSTYCWAEQGCPPASPGHATCNVIIEPGCNTYFNYVPLAFGLFFLLLAVATFVLLMKTAKK
jgi:hypothetical protein